MGTGGPSPSLTPTSRLHAAFALQPRYSSISISASLYSSQFAFRRPALLLGDPYGIRTHVAGVRGRSLRPLDQRAISFLWAVVKWPSLRPTGHFVFYGPWSCTSTNRPHFASDRDSGLRPSPSGLYISLRQPASPPDGSLSLVHHQGLEPGTP